MEQPGAKHELCRGGGGRTNDLRRSSRLVYCISNISSFEPLAPAASSLARAPRRSSSACPEKSLSCRIDVIWRGHDVGVNDSFDQLKKKNRFIYEETTWNLVVALLLPKVKVIFVG